MCPGLELPGPRRYLSLVGTNTPSELAVAPQTLLGQIFEFMGSH